MLYVKIRNGQPVVFPYTLDMFRNDNANTSFPRELSQQLLSHYGVEPVVEHDIGDIDTLTQRFTWGMPELRDGRWHQTWSISQVEPEQASENIRHRRNQLLMECDWTQVADAPVDREAWAQYRQQLRDIPNQAGFPYQVAWPFAPNS